MKMWSKVTMMLAVVGIVSLVGLVHTARAVAPRPGLLEELREQGKLSEYLELRRMARAKGVWGPNPKTRAIRTPLAAGVTATTYRIPCILVDFSDNPWNGGGVAATPEMFDSLLFSEGLNPTGSLKEFYEQASSGALEIEGVVVGWFRMPNTYAYYMNNQSGLGNYPQNSQRLAEVAIDSASKYLDFSQFDNWPVDSTVDGVMIVVPGTGAEETGDRGSIHSHRYVTSVGKFYNGVLVTDYTIQPEETNSTHGPMNAIGVFCHEWGHIFDLPDLYDLDQCDSLELCEGDLSYGLGDWSLMALGNWLPSNLSHTPSQFDAWCRLQLGFASAVNVTTNMTDVVIAPVAESGTVYRIWEGGATSGNEYFLVEYRRRTGFDSKLPGGGLLIYHVDEFKTSNREQWIEGIDPPSEHYKVALEQADGLFALERLNDHGSSGDVYRADSAGFDQLSYPSSRKYTGEPTQVAVWNISDTGGTMTANFDVTYSRPYLASSGYATSELVGDGDGILEQGETFELVFNVTNELKSTSNVTVTVSAPGSGLTFDDDQFSISTLTNGATADNSSDPIQISIPADFRSRTIEFLIDIAAEGGIYHWQDSLSLAIGAPHVLIVDDDRGGNVETKYTTALSQIGEVHDVWSIAEKGTPPLDSLQRYPVVFWATGASNNVSPTTDGVNVIKQYLDADGRLLLTGQDIIENVSQRGDTDLINNYLGVDFAGNALFAAVNGVDGDPIGAGVFLNAGSAGGSQQTSADSLSLVNGSIAVPSHYYFIGGGLAGVHVDNGFRLVFFGFGADMAPLLDENPSPQAQLLERIIDWLDDGMATAVLQNPIDQVDAASVPRGFELLQNYPNPFNAGTVIPFTITGPAGGEVTLEVFNILGRHVITLLDDRLEPARYQVNWDGRDEEGRPLASGVYLYRLTVNDKRTAARQMVLLK